MELKRLIEIQGIIDVSHRIFDKCVVGYYRDHTISHIRYMIASESIRRIEKNVQPEYRTLAKKLIESFG